MSSASGLSANCSRSGHVGPAQEVAHGYRVDAGPARFLNVCVPGRLDRFVGEVAAGEPFDEVAARYGISYL